MRPLLLAVLALAAAACGDDDAAPFATTITVSSPAGDVAVDLATLDQTTFEGKAAIRLTRVVDAAALAAPWGFQYNLVGASDALAALGARARLPFPDELAGGFLVYDGDDLVVAWDTALGLPAALAVRGMAGGRIVAVPIPTTEVVIAAGAVRAAVDVTTLATALVTDYKHPEDGAVPMAALADLFAAAGVDPTPYAFRITGADGFMNTDDNLMPWANGAHGYLEPTARKVILEEAWDTSECCWRVYDTVRIQGVTP